MVAANEEVPASGRTITRRPRTASIIVALEWAYDRTSHIGKLDEAAAKSWTVVSMKDDWKTIFPPTGGR